MPTLNASIQKKIVKKALFEMGLKKQGPFLVKVTSTAQIHAPSDPQDQSALFIMHTNVESSEIEGLHIEFEVQFLFSFSSIPEDYDEVAAQICSPLAEKEIFELIDRGLECIGYPKMELATQTPQESHLETINDQN